MRGFLARLIKPETSVGRWLIALLIAAVLTLGSLGYLEPVKTLLHTEALTYTLGNYSVSLYQVLKGLVALVALFWVAAIISATGENRLKKLEKIRAANRALLIKGFQSLVYLVFSLFALDILGIDLAALAVLGGAIGIGIGFGLQKIASNFISGLILLMEKSVEEGDLIQLNDGIYGFVRQTGARYTLIETFDGKEIMVPNEDFVTNRVTNWTYSNSRGRVEILLGVSYDSDIEKARELMLEIAKAHPRCSAEPVPQCYVRDFGQSSIDLLLYFWVDDVSLGRYEPRSDVLRTIWKRFKSEGITIPFPQRDITIKNPEVLK